MEDWITIGGFKIQLLTEEKIYLNEVVCRIIDLSEELCKKMVTEKDAGNRYSWDSRFTYHTEYDNAEDLNCGTARAAVQRVILQKLQPKSMKQFIRIGK